MPANTTLLLYLVSLLSGGVGGAGGASWHFLSGRPVTRQLIMAYMVIGAVVGIFVGGFMMLYAIAAGMDGTLVHHLVVVGVGSGFFASTALALVRKIACIALEARGVRLEVKLRDDNQGGGDD